MASSKVQVRMAKENDVMRRLMEDPEFYSQYFSDDAMRAAMIETDEAPEYYSEESVSYVDDDGCEVTHTVIETVEQRGGRAIRRKQTFHSKQRLLSNANVATQNAEKRFEDDCHYGKAYSKLPTSRTGKAGRLQRQAEKQHLVAKRR